MTINFSCDHCGKTLSTSDEKAGRKAKCPGCGEFIVVPAPDLDSDVESAAEEPTEGDFGELPSISTSSRRSAGSRKIPCPMCGEQVAASARQCEFCGEPITEKSGSSGTATVINISDVVSTTWQVFQRSMGLAIGGIIISHILQFLLVICCYIAGIVVVVGTFAVMFAGGQGGGAPELTIAGIALMGFGILAVIFIGMFAYIWLQLGVTRFLLSLVRENPTSLELLFSGGRFVFRGWLTQLLLTFINAIPAVILMLIMAAIVGVGPNQRNPEPAMQMMPILLQIFGYAFQIIILLFTWPCLWTIVDEDQTVIGSLSRALELTKGNRLSVFVLLLLAVVLFITGLLTCVGWIFTTPLIYIGMAVTYLKMRGETVRA